MSGQFALEHVRLNVPILSNITTNLIAGPGKFRGPSRNQLIELTGKPLALCRCCAISGRILTVGL